MAALPPVDDDDDNDRRMLLGQGRADVADGHFVGGYAPSELPPPYGVAAELVRPHASRGRPPQSTSSTIRLAKRRTTGAF